MLHVITLLDNDLLLYLRTCQSIHDDPVTNVLNVDQKLETPLIQCGIVLYICIHIQIPNINDT